MHLFTYLLLIVHGLPKDLISHQLLFQIYKDSRITKDSGINAPVKYIVPKPIRKVTNPHLFG
mgnify:CR=1 FL=1